MNILVTGGLGFVGVNLIGALARVGGFQVTVIDNEIGGKRAHAAGLAAEVLIGDLRDEALVDRLVSRCDGVVHLAADTRVLDFISDPLQNFDINVSGSLNLLEAMRRHGKKRIVFASTGGAIVGEAEPPLHENMAPRPISPYGASKLAIEGYLSAYQGSYGFQPLALRFSNVYGPRSFHKGSVVAAFFKAYLAGKRITVYGDGEQTRNFIRRRPHRRNRRRLAFADIRRVSAWLWPGNQRERIAQGDVQDNWRRSVQARRLRTRAQG